MIHMTTCETCDTTFAYDAPVNPAIEPRFCSSACARVEEGPEASQ